MKKTIYFLLAALLCAGFAGCAKEAESDEIALSEGQTLLIGQIDSISGNEMTVSLMNAIEVDSTGQGGSSMQRPEGTSGMQMPSKTGMPTGTWAPFGSSGSRPSRGQNSGTNPSNTASGNGQSSEGGNVSSTPSPNGGAQGETSQNGESTGESQKVTQYQATGETKTLLIPVNTPVTTQLGAVTTFARLAADDVIKMVMQDDVVMAIYIVG